MDMSETFKLRLAGVLFVLGIGSVIAGMAYAQHRESTGMQISKDFLMSETTHDPEMFMGYGETLAVALPHPFVYRYKHFTTRNYKFNCENSLDDLTIDQHTRMLGFYKACETALDLINVPADPAEVDAAREEVPSLVHPPSGIVQRMDGTGICNLVKGKPFPGTGQTFADFMNKKALCTAYVESL